MKVGKVDQTQNCGYRKWHQLFLTEQLIDLKTLKLLGKGRPHIYVPASTDRYFNTYTDVMLHILM